jgi:hypothetical protein
MCPKGDDPLTLDQNYREILLTVKGSFSGKLGIEFMGKTSFVSLTNPSSSDCISALQSSGSYGYVGCNFTAVSSSEYKYQFVIYSWPVYPVENNLYSHEGNPSASAFYCDASQATGTLFCSFTDVSATNIRGN